MLINILINTLGTPKNYTYNSKTTKFEFNCPRCTEDNMGIPDNKHNLGILLTKKKKVFNCWKCGYKGNNISYLLKEYANEIDYKTYLEFDLEHVKIEDDKKIFNYVNLPKEFIPFDQLDVKNDIQHLKAYNYLLDTRKIPLDLIKTRNIGVCFEGYYKNRIIIPSYDSKNELNYFIARTFTDEIPSYLVPNKEKDDTIFNDYFINWNHPIYLVEGVFDELSLPINTISLTGKKILDGLTNKLILANTPVFIILDEGERENNEAEDIKNYLLLRGVNVVKKIKINYKDLNKILTDFGKEKIINDVLLNKLIIS